MRILAIDPGNADSGWVIYDGSKVHECGVYANMDMLRAVQLMGVDVLAIEMMAARGMPVSNDEMETLVWIGRYKQVWHMPEDVILAYRRDVKLYLCEKPTAKDANVSAALREIIGPPGTKKKPGPTYGVTSHAWAALAVAVYVRDKVLKETGHAPSRASDSRSSLRRRARL